LFFIFLFIKFYIGFNTVFCFVSIKISGFDIFYCSFVGIVLTFFLVLTTEYYTSTSFYPVRNISSASTKGHAPNIIQGLAFSMEATALPVFFVILAILISHSIAGIIGVALSAASMVSLSGIIVTLDAYGPVTDNAGGIAEMSNMSNEVRVITDSLDAVGNTTKAVTKGYAIGSAGLGSLVLFITYTKDLEYYFPNYDLFFSLTDPFVIVGLFFGGIIPYLFSSFSIRAVGSVAGKVVDEVRYQFINIPGIMQGSVRPDYEKVIDLLTKESIKEMIIPAIFPVIFPVIFYLFIYFIFGQSNAFVALGSMILGIIIIGIFLAISMTSGGGAWDNAKKYIEDGNFGGKGSFAHQSAVTGDMVGDPYKDTAGPAINPLIKVVSIISLLLIVIFSKV
jgi:K(+)-stimulated pyrophosphate-energized sodium pump